MTTYEQVKQKMEACANTGTPMPAYKCHKEVWALKIKEIWHEPGMPFIVVPEESRFAPFVVSVDYIAKHKPQIGGYYVVYKDGYQSFSPAEAFEEGYSKI